MPIVTLNIVGLLANLAGVILLFLFGMPFRIRTEGKTAQTVVLAGAKDTVEAERLYGLLSWLGLFLIVLGTILQVWANLLA